MSPSPTPAPTPDGADPVRLQRARIARLVSTGTRVGSLLFGLAVLVFVLGFLVGWSPGLAWFVGTCLVVGSIVLAPAIVAGYGIRAAEREDREQGW